MFAFMNHSSYLCINIMSQMMYRNLTPRMSSAVLRPPYESSRFCFVMEEEIWKPVVGYEGFYEVSNLGHIRSLNYNKTGKTEAIRPSITTNGRAQVILAFNGRKTHKLVHRIVAEAFIPNQENKPCIDHIDTNPLNNLVDNLRWCTRSENNLNMITRKRLSAAGVFKMKNQWSSGCFDKQKRAIAQLSLGGELLRVWESMMDASRGTGIPAGDICGCCKGVRGRKTRGGYKWCYLSDYGKEEDRD